MKYYIEWECPSCEEANYYGPCLTTIEHNGDPVVLLDAGSQQSYTCEHCDKTYFTSDFDLYSEDEV